MFKVPKNLRGRLGLFTHKENYHSENVNKKSELKCDFGVNKKSEKWDFGCTRTLKNLQGKRHHHKSIHGGEKKKKKKYKK